MFEASLTFRYKNKSGLSAPYTAVLLKCMVEEVKGSRFSHFFSSPLFLWNCCVRERSYSYRSTEERGDGRKKKSRKKEKGLWKKRKGECEKRNNHSLKTFVAFLTAVAACDKRRKKGRSLNLNRRVTEKAVENSHETGVLVAFCVNTFRYTRLIYPGKKKGQKISGVVLMHGI